eukprot:1933120-Pyramimonas_sp.AAC.1
MANSVSCYTTGYQFANNSAPFPIPTLAQAFRKSRESPKELATVWSSVNRLRDVLLPADLRKS